MPTVGIKTSLHEVRHAIIAELYGCNVTEIRVTERFSGYTNYSNSISDKNARLMISLAPYIKRILSFTWDRFMEEYGTLTDISLNKYQIEEKRKDGVFDKMIQMLNTVIDDNKEIIDDLVSYLDRNGKGHPEYIDRKRFIETIKKHGGLKRKHDLLDFTKLLGD